MEKFISLNKKSGIAMELIRQLAEQMEDEICDSKHYAKWAVEVKDKYHELAETLYTISLQEEKHM